MLDKKYTLEYCKTHPVAILVKSSEEVKKVDEILKSDHYQSYSLSYGENHCISTRNNEYCSLVWYFEHDYEIIKASDFIEAHTPKKPEYKQGMWIKLQMSNGRVSIKRIAKLISQTHGLTDDGSPIDLSEAWGTYIPMTPEEVKAHLIAEANKRGYKIGTTIKQSGKFVEVHGSPWDCETTLNDSIPLYMPKTDTFEYGGRYIYCQGYWAPIIPTTVKLMFGSIEVECDKENHIAKTATDEFTKDQIWEFLIWWINKPDQLKGKNNNYCFTCSEFQFKLGTVTGYLSELQAIYDAIK
jgi:hypothetical protein